jgi:hypothetical protein
MCIIIAERRSIAVEQHVEHPQSIMSREETGKQGGRGKKKGLDVIKTFSGNDPAYLTARIAVERPDILERMRMGSSAGGGRRKPMLTTWALGEASTCRPLSDCALMTRKRKT